jgi:hypothetical protein
MAQEVNMTTPTGRPHGGKREGAGRPFGSTNHKSRQIVVEAVRNGDIMPLDYLLATMRDETAPHRERLQAAAIAAPYCHPKLTAQITGFIDPAKLSDDELLATLARLEAQAAALPEPPPDNPAPGAVVRPAEEWQPPPPMKLPPVRRPGAAPEPAESRHLRYDPLAKKMVQTVQ